MKICREFEDNGKTMQEKLKEIIARRINEYYCNQSQTDSTSEQTRNN